MNQFTISELQKYSGVNVHSIRAWEKRYKALKPHRTKGNTRYYDGNQLRRLLNIVSLLNEDYKISDLCAMPDSKLTQLLQMRLDNERLSSENDEFLISQMVASAMGFDEPLFDKIFNCAIAKYGIESAYLKVIYPSVQRIGVLWTIEGVSPAHEHFITHLTKQKLILSASQLPFNSKSKHHWVLFLPEGEFHEIGLLMANYLIRNSGERTTYIGANIPFDTLKDAIKTIDPTCVLSFLVAKNNPEQDKELINSLSKAFPNQQIYIGANAERIAQIKKPKNITLLDSMVELQKKLKK